MELRSICAIYMPQKWKSQNCSIRVTNARGYIGWKHNHCMIQDGILDKTLPIGKIPKDRKDLGLVDIWRLVNPREKQRNITFFPKYFVIK